METQPDANERVSTQAERISAEVAKAESPEDVAMMLRGYAAFSGETTITDPETGNALDIDRAARAIHSGDSGVMADEVPVFLIRTMKEHGIIE